MIRALATTVLFLASLTAEAAGPRLEFQPHFDGLTRGYLLVTSREDRVAIKKIEINRGNCAPLNSDRLQALPTLAFGQSLKVGFDQCVPIEVRIETDLGLAAVSNADGRIGLTAEVLGHDPHNANIARLFIVNYGGDTIDLADYDGIEVNRNNCYHHTDTWRSKLRFGEYLMAFTFCEPLEVSVRTKGGTVTLKLR